MSSDNSPGSGSNQPPNGQDRYSRAKAAAAAPLQNQTGELNRRRDTARDRAIETLALQDRANRAQHHVGRSAEIDDISKLFGGGEPAEKSRKGGDGSDDRAPIPPKREPAGSAQDPSRADPADDIDPDQAERPNGPKTLADFAEEHELKVSELYKLAVTTDDGESYTLSELKDKAKAIATLDDREADFEDQRTEHFNMLAAQGEKIQALLGRLKAYVPAETLAKAAAEADGDPEAARAAAVQKLREWFPEWKDHQAQTRDREAVSKRLSAYGFSAYEVQSINEPRIIRFLVEACRRLDRYDKLRADGKRDMIPTTQEPSRRIKPSRTSSTDDRARQIAQSGDKIGGIATLLGG